MTLQRGICESVLFKRWLIILWITVKWLQTQMLTGWKSSWKELFFFSSFFKLVMLMVLRHVERPFEPSAKTLIEEFRSCKYRCIVILHRVLLLCLWHAYKCKNDNIKRAPLYSSNNLYYSFCYRKLSVSLQHHLCRTVQHFSLQ